MSARKKITSNFKVDPQHKYLQIRGVPTAYFYMFRRLLNDMQQQWEDEGKQGDRPIQADVFVKVMKSYSELHKIKKEQ